MKQLHKITFIIILFVSSALSITAQVSTAWMDIWNGGTNGYDLAKSIAMDASGNVYVTGESRQVTVMVYDCVTKKYSSNGNCLWTATYNGGLNSDDGGWDVIVDKAGNIYVTGYTRTNSSPVETSFLIIKYTSAGTQRWVRTYNVAGSDIDIGKYIAVDDSCNVYVAGWTGATWGGTGVGSDYNTVKYDSTGAFKWVASYNGIGSGDDRVRGIGVDANRNVYITGESYDGSNYLPVTVKYNPSGVQQWANPYGNSGAYCGGADIAVDASGNAFVTGTTRNAGTNEDCFTIKYNTNGTVGAGWPKNYATSGSGFGFAVTIDDSSNVYVAGSGFAMGNNEDYAIIKYDNAGNQKWLTTWNNPIASDFDNPTDIAIDGLHNVYVTGYTLNLAFNNDIATVKFDANGVEQWSDIYDGGGASFPQDLGSGIVADNNGCAYMTGYIENGTNTDYITVKYCDAVAVDADFSNNTVCFGDSTSFADISTGVPTSWSWNFGDATSGGANTSTAQTPKHLFTTDGTFSVKLVVSDGSITDSITIPVIVNPNPVADAGTDRTICAGDTIGGSPTASGGSGSNYSYSWAPSTGLNSTTIANPFAWTTITTVYIVTVTDGNGCSNIDSVVVAIDSIPIVTITGDTLVCYGNSTVLTAGGGTTYKWNTGDTTSSITVYPTINSTFTVTVSDGPCSAVDSIHIIILGDVPHPVSANWSICQGDSIACPEISDTSSSNLYQLAKWITIVKQTTGDTIWTLTYVNYTTGFAITYLNYCDTFTYGVSIIVNPAYTNYDTATICQGDSILLGGIYRFTTGTYYDTLSTINNCDSIIATTLTVNPKPIVNITGDTIICNGDTTNLTASGGGSYLWSTTDNTSSITIHPIVTTIYTVIVTNAYNCTATEKITVTVNPLPIEPDVTDKELCTYTHEATFTVNNAVTSYQYYWYDSIGGIVLSGCNNANCSSIDIDNIIVPDEFYVRSRDTYGCYSLYDTIYVTAAIMPVADFSIETTPPYYEGQQIQFRDESTNADDWEWSFGDGQYSTDRHPEHGYTQEGLYWVQLIVSTQGTPPCRDTLRREDYVQVVKKTKIYVPSTFTPNGDNLNDVLKVLGEDIESIEFKIYNQWGILLFETKNQTTGWDGIYSGSPQPEGNYVYMLQAATSDGQNIFQQGIISLVK